MVSLCQLQITADTTEHCRGQYSFDCGAQARQRSITILGGTVRCVKPQISPDSPDHCGQPVRGFMSSRQSQSTLSDHHPVHPRRLMIRQRRIPRRSSHLTRRVEWIGSADNIMYLGRICKDAWRSRTGRSSISITCYSREVEVDSVIRIVIQVIVGTR